MEKAVIQQSSETPFRPDLSRPVPMDSAAACVAVTDAGLVHPTAFVHAEGAFVSGLTPDMRTRYDGRGETYEDAVSQLALKMNRDVVQPSKAMLDDIAVEEGIA